MGATLNVATLTAPNRAAFDAFLARRGGVVGLGTAGASFSNNASLLSVTATAGQSLVSGVVNVVNHGGPVINGAQPYSWVFPAVWYSGLGANAVVEQSYAADPLLSGWWQPNAAGTNGQAQAAGQASIVRALAPGGSGLVLIGTSPTVRLHAKGLQPQLGRALLWTATQTASVTSTEGTAGGSVPATLALTLGAPATFGAFAPGLAKEYTAATTGNVISTAGDAALSVADSSTTNTGKLVNGSFALAQTLQAGTGATFAPIPATVKTWTAPTSNESVAIGFKQSIGVNEALRAGSYSKTLTFTLSTTTP